MEGEPSQGNPSLIYEDDKSGLPLNWLHPIRPMHLGRESEPNGPSPLYLISTLGCGDVEDTRKAGCRGIIAQVVRAGAEGVGRKGRNAFHLGCYRGS